MKEHADIKSSSVEQFRKLYFEEFGEELSMDKAAEMATRLLNVFAEIAKDFKRN